MLALRHYRCKDTVSVRMLKIPSMEAGTVKGRIWAVWPSLV